MAAETFEMIGAAGDVENVEQVKGGIRHVDHGDATLVGGAGDHGGTGGADGGEAGAGGKERGGSGGGRLIGAAEGDRVVGEGGFVPVGARGLPAAELDGRVAEIRRE